jgi:hypothetical protein
MLPYVVGLVLAIGVAVFARSVGFDRDRAFYPTVLIVIAAVAGFKGSPWIVIGGLAAMAFRTPSTATSSQTPACPPGGRHGVWRMTSAPLRLLPGS